MNPIEAHADNSLEYSETVALTASFLLPKTAFGNRPSRPRPLLFPSLDADAPRPEGTPHTEMWILSDNVAARSVYVTCTPTGEYDAGTLPLMLIFAGDIPRSMGYYSSSATVDTARCVICQEDIVDGEVVMKAGCCINYFHMKELSDWVSTEFRTDNTRPPKCPGCMQSLGSPISDESMRPIYPRITEMNPVNPLIDFKLPE